MAMPSAQGLFHKAAVLSGSHLRQAEPGDSARLARAVLDELGLTASTLARIHDVPTDVLLGAGLAGRQQLVESAVTGAAVPNWGPVVDGTVLPAHAFDPVAPAMSAGVPLLVGNTFVEFGGGINNPTAADLTLDGLREELRATAGPQTDDLIAAYQRTFPEARPFEIRGLVIGTRAYRINAIKQAELKAAQGSAPVYVYWFGWKTPVLDGRPLAYHCQDLAFWFDNIDLAAQATGGTDDARQLATTMSRAFVAFARTGDPNAAGLPDWPAFTPEERSMMLFENERAGARADPDREARELLASMV
jgi:para-nitrobenzyl esterase